MAQVHLTDDARDDIRDLDGSARKQVLKALKKLEDSPDQLVFPLGNNPKGNLTGLRKLVIGGRDYRAVYRVESGGEVVVIIVVLKRADQEVYELAVARLKTSDDEDVRQLAEGFKRLME